VPDKLLMDRMLCAGTAGDIPPCPRCQKVQITYESLDWTGQKSFVQKWLCRRCKFTVYVAQEYAHCNKHSRITMIIPTIT
jgi:hypothetical protein